MMKICGITAEYNPFHKGHAYHLAEAKRQSGADALIVVMSGHFVQRGEPAVFNPYERARDALMAGADAVFMMPPEASTSSAEGFAEYSTGLMDKLGCDAVSCGVEPEMNRDRIIELGEMLAEETEEFSRQIRNLMKTGISYPSAVAEILGTGQLGPNALLAAEYVKAMKRNKTNMEFVPVARTGSAYNDTEIHPDEYPSATALRKALLTENADGTLRCGAERASSGFCRPLGPDDFLPEIINSIRRSRDLEQYLDCDAAIASRLRKSEFRYRTYEEMVKDIKTREYTYTRISRAIIHIFLEICERKVKADSAQLIGFRNTEVLSKLKRRAAVPIISKAADYKEALESSARAADLYNQVYWKKYAVELPGFFRQNILQIR